MKQQSLRGKTVVFISTPLAQDTPGGDTESGVRV